MQPLLLLRCVCVTGRKAGCTKGPLLAGKLLALHEIEHRHQGPRYFGISGAVCSFEHHHQQPRDQPDERGGRFCGCQRPAGNASSQCGKGIQRVQHKRNAAEQPCTIAHLAGVGVKRIEMFAHGLFHPAGLGCLLLALLTERHAVGAQKNIGQATLFLKGMNQPPDGACQLAGKRKLFQLRDLALAGSNKKTES